MTLTLMDHGNLVMITMLTFKHSRDDCSRNACKTEAIKVRRRSVFGALSVRERENRCSVRSHLDGGDRSSFSRADRTGDQAVDAERLKVSPTCDDVPSCQSTSSGESEQESASAVEMSAGRIEL